MRVTAVALLSVLALITAGCGGDSKGPAEGASVVSASAPAFVSINSDLRSDQWRAADDLLRKFPGRSQLLQSLTGLLTEAELDYEADIEPALGDELDFVWLDFAAGRSNVVGITQPDDEEALRRLVQKANASDESGEDVLIGEVGDWVVLSDTQAKIDRFGEQAGDEEKLADDAIFTDALDELPDDALVTAYGRGEDLFLAFQELAQGAAAAFQLQPNRRPEFLAAALAAEGDGLRLVGATRTEQEPESAPGAYESRLLEDVPGDAVAFFTLRGGQAFDSQLRQLEENPLYLQLLRELERELGFSLKQVLALLENEIALYVRPQVPLPELTLLLEAKNEAATRTAIDGVFTAISRAEPAQPCHEPGDQAGVAVRCIEFEDFALRSATFDGKAVVTTGARAIAEIRSPGEKLPDSDSFSEARDAAGLPDATPGFVWVDLEGLLPMLLGLADAADEDVPAEVGANLEPLQSLVAWAEQDGRTSSFSAFLEID